MDVNPAVSAFTRIAIHACRLTKHRFLCGRITMPARYIYAVVVAAAVAALRDILLARYIYAVIVPAAVAALRDILLAGYIYAVVVAAAVAALRDILLVPVVTACR